MKDSLIKFEQVYNDPVWGMEGTCIRSDLIRVTRNRLRRAVFYWVGHHRELTEKELAHYRKNYPLVYRVRFDK